MTEIDRDDLLKLARRLEAVSDNVRRIHNDSGLGRTLSEALTHLIRAEALLIEAAA